MRSRFLVEPEAEAELGEAVDWYETRSHGLGSEFLRAVRAVFALIRRALVRRFPYAVYYVLDPDQISVIACIHTHRHPRRWQSRR